MKPPTLLLNKYAYDKRHRIELTPYEVTMLTLKIHCILTKIRNPEKYIRGLPAHENLPEGCYDIAEAIKETVYRDCPAPYASCKEMEQRIHAAIIFGFRYIKAEVTIPNHKVSHFIDNNENFTHDHLIKCLEYTIDYFSGWVTEVCETWNTIGFFIPYNYEQFVNETPFRKSTFYGKLNLLEKDGTLSKRPIKQNIDYDNCFLHVRIVKDPTTDIKTYKRFKKGK